MSPSILKKEKVFSPSELEKAKEELIYKKLKILPDEVTENGYYYDPDDLMKAINKIKPPHDRKNT
jgi:hypothetical protein